jgi:two-component system cell cycle response regulator DivK
VKRIAVVEDNPDNRLLLQAMLADAYEIAEYESGQQALDGVRASRPDLMLLDISLPEMDGVEVLRRLRADPDTAALPVIALTAHAMGGDRERFLAQGFDGYVGKPIEDQDVLVAAIERLLPRA